MLCSIWIFSGVFLWCSGFSQSLCILAFWRNVSQWRVASSSWSCLWIFGILAIAFAGFEVGSFGFAMMDHDCCICILQSRIYSTVFAPAAAAVSKHASSSSITHSTTSNHTMIDQTNYDQLRFLKLPTCRSPPMPTPTRPADLARLTACSSWWIFHDFSSVLGKMVGLNRIPW